MSTQYESISLLIMKLARWLISEAKKLDVSRISLIYDLFINETLKREFHYLT